MKIKGRLKANPIILITFTISIVKYATAIHTIRSNLLMSVIIQIPFLDERLYLLTPP